MKHYRRFATLVTLGIFCSLLSAAQEKIDEGLIAWLLNSKSSEVLPTITVPPPELES